MPRVRRIARVVATACLVVAAAGSWACPGEGRDGLLAVTGDPASRGASPVPPWTRGNVLGEPADLPLPVSEGPGTSVRWTRLASVPESAFRNSPPRSPPAPGVVRIVVLGGAFERSGAATEALRQFQPPSGPVLVEVLELGLPLGHTAVAVELARRHLDTWRPHLVVVGVGFEDLLFYSLRAHVIDRSPMGSEDLDAPALVAPPAGVLAGCGEGGGLPRPPGFFFEASLGLQPVQNLWTLSRLAFAHGADVAVVLDPVADPARLGTADRNALADELRERFPSLGDVARYESRRAVLAEAVRGFARDSGVLMVPVASDPGPRAGLGVPTTADVRALAAALGGALGPWVTARLAQGGLPTVNPPVPAAIPLAVPPDGLPATVSRDGTCVSGPCPSGACFVPALRATYGYDDSRRTAALALVRTFVGWADENWFEDDGPPVEVQLSPFCIDRTEVTADVQASCVASGACPSLVPPVGLAATDLPRWPAVTPAALDAEVLCAWRGGRLPTDVEWEAAARGGDGRVYPFGDVFTGREANFLGSEHPQGPAVPYSDGHPGLAPVGAFEGRSPFGPVDMAGNLFEWVSDCFAMDAHLRMAPGAVDPVAPRIDGCVRFLRGGGYHSIAGILERRNARGEFDVAPSTRGARCVYDFGTTHRPFGR